MNSKKTISVIASPAWSSSATAVATISTGTGLAKAMLRALQFEHGNANRGGLTIFRWQWPSFGDGGSFRKIRLRSES